MSLSQNKKARVFTEIFIWRNFPRHSLSFFRFEFQSLGTLRPVKFSKLTVNVKRGGGRRKRKKKKRNELERCVYSSGWLRECVRKGAIHESRSGRTNITRSIHTLDGSNERCYAYLVWYFLPSLRAFTRERGQTFYGCDHDLRCNSDRTIFQSLTRSAKKMINSRSVLCIL